MGKKKKDGRFQLKRAGGDVMKSKETKKHIPPKVKERIKVKEVITKTNKAIVPIEDETEIEGNGLSDEEMGVLDGVEDIIKKKTSFEPILVGVPETEPVKEISVFGNLGGVENTLKDEMGGWNIPRHKIITVIELTPDSPYNRFEDMVSRIRNFKDKLSIRISNGSVQSKIFGKAIEEVYLKERAYKLKTVPYLHVVRKKEIFEINLYSEIVTVNDYAYFVVVEVSKENKTEDIQKVILLDTNFILK